MCWQLMSSITLGGACPTWKKNSHCLSSGSAQPNLTCLPWCVLHPPSVPHLSVCWWNSTKPYIFWTPLLVKKTNGSSFFHSSNLFTTEPLLYARHWGHWYHHEYEADIWTVYIWRQGCVRGPHCDEHTELGQYRSQTWLLTRICVGGNTEQNWKNKNKQNKKPTNKEWKWRNALQVLRLSEREKKTLSCLWL